MKKRTLKIISTLLALLLLQGLPVLSANAGGAPDNTATASDYGEFCDRLAALIRERGQEKSAQAQDFSGGAYASMRVIVKKETDDDALDPTRFGAVCAIKGPDGFYILQFDSETGAESCVRALKGQSGVRYAVPDTRVWLCGEDARDGAAVDAADKNAGEAPEQSAETAADATHLSWGPEYIESDAYAECLKTVENPQTVIVAVVDSGVAHHDLLDPVVMADGIDFVGSDPREDKNGHGTHVAGIVADCTQGLDIKIMSVRVLDADGSGYTSSVVAGIAYAVSRGADVINYSITGAHDASKDDAVDDAVENGVTLVCASGNQGDSIVAVSSCPAHNANAVVVGAVNQSGERCGFSNYGETLDVVAPGSQIVSCGLNNDVVTKNGTSMATAFMSAAAAMYRLENPSASPADTEKFIKDMSFDLGDAGFDIYCGCGVPKLSAAYYSGTFSWEPGSDGIVITGVSGVSERAVVPYAIGARRVTGIGNGAFAGCGTVKRISLPDGIESIGESAFRGCSALTEINIPDSVTSVGDYAFLGCDALAGLRFGAVTSALGACCAGYSGNAQAPLARPDFVVEGYTGTAAQGYAAANGLVFRESRALQVTATFTPVYMAAGSTILPEWTVYPSSLSSVCAVSVSSSDDSVVRAGFDARLTAVKTGGAHIEIRASRNGEISRSSFGVTVLDRLFELDDSISMTYKDTKRLTATPNVPGYSADDVVWSAENGAVASVSHDGAVTAKGRGTTVVRAATPDGRYSAECAVTVDYSFFQWLIIIVLFGWIWYI